MPVLLLSPRMTTSSQLLQQAALARGWRVERLTNWRPPSWLRDEPLVFHRELLLADAIAGRGWAIIEANAARGSGLYGCDTDQVLTVLSRASLKEEAVTASERAWVRPIPEVSG